MQCAAPSKEGGNLSHPLFPVSSSLSLRAGVCYAIKPKRSRVITPLSKWCQAARLDWVMGREVTICGTWYDRGLQESKSSEQLFDRAEKLSMRDRLTTVASKGKKTTCSSPHISRPETINVCQAPYNLGFMEINLEQKHVCEFRHRAQTIFAGADIICVSNCRRLLHAAINFILSRHLIPQSGWREAGKSSRDKNQRGKKCRVAWRSSRPKIKWEEGGGDKMKREKAEVTFNNELGEVWDPRAPGGLGDAAVEVLIRSLDSIELEGNHEAPVAQVLDRCCR